MNPQWDGSLSDLSVHKRPINKPNYLSSGKQRPLGISRRPSERPVANRAIAAVNGATPGGRHLANDLDTLGLTGPLSTRAAALRTAHTHTQLALQHATASADKGRAGVATTTAAAAAICCATGGTADAAAAAAAAASTDNVWPEQAGRAGAKGCAAGKAEAGGQSRRHLEEWHTLLQLYKEAPAQAVVTSEVVTVVLDKMLAFASAGLWCSQLLLNGGTAEMLAGILGGSRTPAQVQSKALGVLARVCTAHIEAGTGMAKMVACDAVIAALFSTSTGVLDVAAPAVRDFCAGPEYVQARVLRAGLPALAHAVARKDGAATVAADAVGHLACAGAAARAALASTCIPEALAELLALPDEVGRRHAQQALAALGHTDIVARVCSKLVPRVDHLASEATKANAKAEQRLRAQAAQADAALELAETQNAAIKTALVKACADLAEAKAAAQESNRLRAELRAAKQMISFLETELRVKNHAAEY